MTRRVVGLTGGIGVGKSTVAAVLSELGATIVDCDQLGHKVSEVGGLAYQAMIERFGPQIVGESGQIDRGVLGPIVFNDAQALADLNAITHPAIDTEIRLAIEAAPPDAVVVLDMAILVESDLGRGQYQEVLVVEAPLAQRLERLQTQRSMAVDDARARIANQADDAARRAVADDVIVNDGDVNDLRSAVEDWWHHAASKPRRPTTPK